MKAPPREDPIYVSAARYCVLAGVQLSARTLQNYCRQNPWLAERLGELRWPGRTLFDSRTAADFRRHFVAAEKELRGAQAARFPGTGSPGQSPGRSPETT
jgi:hypothetical protein